MRTLKTGEPCPCCGQPIPPTDPTELLLLTCECVLRDEKGGEPE